MRKLIDSHWHEATSIILRMPGEVRTGYGFWKSDGCVVTVVIDETMYTTHWSNVVVMASVPGVQKQGNRINSHISEIKTAVIAAT